MRVVHLLATGNNGGIERLIYDYSKYSKHENVFIFAWGAGLYGEKLRENNKKVYDINGHKIGNIRTIKAINKIIKNEQPEYVIVHHASSLLRIISLFQVKKKIIIYQHNDPGENFKNLSIKKIIKILISKVSFEHASKIITISEFVKNSLVKSYKIKSNKISVIYNGTDLNEFYFHPHPYDGTIHFVTVARLIQEKGIQNSLKMLVNLPNEIKWDYTIVGDGEYKNELLKIVKTYKMNNVIFLGNRKDVSKILDSKDIFLHLCEWNEGFGIGIIEAMAKGIFCIVNSKGALPEIITDGVDGFVINDSNEVNVVNNIVTSRIKWDEIKQNARKKAENFSIDKFVKSLDGILINVDDRL